MTNQHQHEVARGERFEFGKNWSSFLKLLNEHRIGRAEKSLLDKLGVTDLKGVRFLDIGSGSGLFSLAARRLGATVHSFDYDPQSVACTTKLRERFFPDDPGWVVESGSVLNDSYMRSLGEYDIVYSWGVLHHTGAMWQAIGNAAIPVRANGLLYIAIYNNQGQWSRRWLHIKRMYNRLPRLLKLPFAMLVMGIREIPPMIGAIVRLSPMRYVRRWTRYADSSVRGMSYWHDVIDWVGGYPFEVAKPEEIFDSLKQRQFRLERLVTCAGELGCNEYVFRKVA